MLQTVSIVVKGKVQGVFFRKSTKEKAVEIGLQGIVKNEPDGSVFIQASGDPDQLKQLIAWCKTGPPRAKVTDVNVENITPRAFPGFHIL